MNTYTVLLFILLCIFNFIGCTKDVEDPYTKAEIIYSGSPSEDGCGWLIVIGDTLYSPINLPEKFEIESTTTQEVRIQYQLLNSFFCNWWGSIGYQKLRIMNIKKA